MISKYSYKESNKYNNRTNPSNCKPMESSIRSKCKGWINIVPCSEINDNFYSESNPKYFFMNPVEDDKEYCVNKWKKEHVWYC